MCGRRDRPRQPPNVTLKNQCISFQTVYYSLPSLSFSLSLSLCRPPLLPLFFLLSSRRRSARQLKTNVTRRFLQWNAKKRKPKRVYLHALSPGIPAWALPKPCQSPLDSLCTAFLQPFCSLGTTFLQPFCSLFAAWVQLFYSLAGAWAQPFCNPSTAWVQPFCTLVAQVLHWVHFSGSGASLGTLW